jgi:hypothetical protein
MKRSPQLSRWGSSCVYLSVAAGKHSLLMESAASSELMLFSLKTDPFSSPCGHGIIMRTQEPLFADIQSFFDPMRTRNPLLADIELFSRPCGHKIHYLLISIAFEIMRTQVPLFADIRSFFEPMRTQVPLMHHYPGSFL